MDYQTTKISPMKSYPTYQLHAYSSAQNISVHECFKICILETFKWLRLRLEKFTKIDKLLQTPEPENYKDFSDDSLRSFTIKNSPGIDVIYIKTAGIWTFNISEADMGVNIGTPKERKPVQGRSFSTDVTFKELSDCVEIGIRTICNEPTDTAVDCEVFRPSLVKMLVSNPLVGLKYHYPINGQAFKITSKTDVEKLSRVIKDNDYCFPVILVADAPYKETSVSIEDIEKDFASTLDISSLNSPCTPINADLSKVNIDKKNVGKVKISGKKIQKEIEKEIAKAFPKEPMIVADVNKNKKVKEKEKIIDYQSLATSLIGFATVFFISESSFKWIKNKFGISMKSGNIIILNGKTSVPYEYDQYKNKLKQFQKELQSDIKSIQKRRQIKFGSILFSSDARLLEIEEKRNEDISKKETAKLLLNENNELKKKIEEFERRENDANQNNNELRAANRRITQLESELEEIKNEYKELKSKYDDISDSYKKYSSQRTDFYIKKCIAAAAFPTNKNDVCEWAEKAFSDTLIISSRAKNELSKYSGAMSVSMLCDGLYYMHALVLNYRKKITDQELSYYAESGRWTVEKCGKLSLREFKKDYNVYYNSRKCELNSHIKYGVNSEQLIRIYFCYLKDEKKILVGSMPGHLPTSTQNT